MRPTELRLPHAILQRASLRANEYAWPIEDIPNVIEAARQANLASIGGQLQFRLPDGGTCECYWVEVDTYKSVPASLPWQERVDQTAAVALADFSHLLSKFDFVTEGGRLRSISNALKRRAAIRLRPCASYGISKTADLPPTRRSHMAVA